ncbi:related to haloacid dehalogenase, type II [Cephalotrichum gorgonifer]|uniref:Related to haloacid dehalogenase, type II n=1 Tax=Cephalotrichum gorgonifer TaxID=2041049 RepID=A0AAE8MQ92_9PEZI|nr:related to haloacid dehalogenase, type II [Cephalotrichum gorgonifer]
MEATKALEGVTALTFDVFGTCVDWRTTVVEALEASLVSKAESTRTPPHFRERAAALTSRDCEDLAQKWRASYWAFTRSYVPGTTPWKDIDTHHRESLAALLEEDAVGLRGAYSDAEVAELSLVWHRLAPWGDTTEGLRRLGARFRTATLSNGNRAILEDLNGMVGGGWDVLLSAEDFAAYKPSPAVYGGAMARLGVAEGEVAMVAAHLNDLEGARRCGMKTVFVERPGEERWPRDRVEEARGWVDVWVTVEEEGLLELARRLAC